MSPRAPQGITHLPVALLRLPVPPHPIPFLQPHHIPHLPTMSNTCPQDHVPTLPHNLPSHSPVPPTHLPFFPALPSPGLFLQSLPVSCSPQTASYGFRELFLWEIPPSRASPAASSLPPASLGEGQEATAGWIHQRLLGRRSGNGREWRHCRSSWVEWGRSGAVGREGGPGGELGCQRGQEESGAGREGS